MLYERASNSGMFNEYYMGKAQVSGGFDFR